MSAIRFSCVALAVAATLHAQQPAPGATAAPAAHAGALVHYGKWAAGALAATFTALGAHEHDQATRAFNQLFDLCRSNVPQCALRPDGTYQDAAAEQLYQRSRQFDSRARVRLLAGQAALLLCAGLFFADLRRHANGPDNIPYHPLELTVEPGRDATRVGVRVTF